MHRAQTIGGVMDFELEGLIDSVRKTHGGGAIELHVGASDEGDVLEAHLFRDAVEESAGGAPTGLRCFLKVHDGRDHNLVVDMRDSGELHQLLCRVVASEGTQNGAQEKSSIPSDFVGFEDCPDF